MHRLPLLHVGLPVGRAHHRLGLAGAEDLEVHALRGRIERPLPASFNGQPLTAEDSKSYRETIAVPACVKACPADALVFGEREHAAEAQSRIAARPEKYVNHVYGEHEAGGTSVIYLSAVPFEKIGFPEVGDEVVSRRRRTRSTRCPRR